MANAVDAAMGVTEAGDELHAKIVEVSADAHDKAYDAALIAVRKASAAYTDAVWRVRELDDATFLEARRAFDASRLAFKEAETAYVEACNAEIEPLPPPSMAAMGVTDEQIDALMQAAGQAGDELQVAVCAIATGRTGDETYARLIEEHRGGLARLGIVPGQPGANERALVVCAEVIADAAGRARS